MNNDFNEDLEWSHNQSSQPWWEEVYRQAFPNFATMYAVNQDGWAQRAGIDRLIVLTDGKTYTVDEKVRRQHWGDILLERWSDKDRKVPGWAWKDQACDFIAYAFATTGVCYLLPVPLLRRALSEHEAEWAENADRKFDRFLWVDAENPTYTTRSLAVPTRILLNAVARAMEIKFRPQSH